VCRSLLLFSSRFYEKAQSIEQTWVEVLLVFLLLLKREQQENLNCLLRVQELRNFSELTSIRNCCRKRWRGEDWIIIDGSRCLQSHWRQTIDGVCQRANGEEKVSQLTFARHILARCFGALAGLFLIYLISTRPLCNKVFAVHCRVSRERWRISIHWEHRIPSRSGMMEVFFENATDAIYCEQKGESEREADKD
jgi:hypothetical protein